MVNSTKIWPSHHSIQWGWSIPEKPKYRAELRTIISAKEKKWESFNPILIILSTKEFTLGNSVTSPGSFRMAKTEWLKQNLVLQMSPKQCLFLLCTSV
jgi:hypothetical protein